MKRDRRFMDWMAREAKESTCSGGAYIAAALVNVNTPIAMGTNEQKSSPFAAYYGNNEHSIYFHAETRVLKKALKYVDKKTINKSTLYVCRVKKLKITEKKFVWSWGLAKPCEGCMEALSDYPPKRIVYSLDGLEEQYEIMKR